MRTAALLLGLAAAAAPVASLRAAPAGLPRGIIRKVASSVRRRTVAKPPATQSYAAASAAVSDGNDPTLTGSIPKNAGLDANGAPKISKILRFSLPALGIYLSSPLLSLIDTAFVGNFAKSSLELAALGPATAICDQTTSICLFLAVATTNILASALAKGDSKEVVQGPVHGLWLSGGLGLVLGGLLQVVAPMAVRAFVGASAPAALVADAVAYVRIRALAMPLVLMTLVAQAGCLGGKDSVSALKACGLASFVNACGDLLFVPGLRMGVAGAAIATALSQLGGALFMTRALFRNVLRPVLPAGAKMDLRPPSLRQAFNFTKFAGPIFFVNIGKFIPYTMATVAVAGAGTLPLAAHQVILGVYFVFVMFSEPMGQVFQAFLPDAKERGRPATLGLVRRGLGMAGALSLIVAAAACLGPLLAPFVFTNDIAVAEQMRYLVPLLFALIVPHPLTMAVEGILLSARDLKFLVGVYLANTAFVAAGMTAVAKLGLGVSGAWSCLIAWNVLRLTEQGSRLWFRRRRLLKLEPVSA